MITTPKVTADSPALVTRRRLLQILTLLAALSTAAVPLAMARDGVEVGGNSAFSRLVPADTIERSGQLQYAQIMREAADKHLLRASGHPDLRRLRAIAANITPFTGDWNPRANDWKWEINLIDSKQINAFCLPGGKIAFYSGILDQLQLTDDEVAMVMGHEIAHALREHARERLGKNAATSIGAGVISQLLGLGDIGQTVTRYGAQLMTLQFSRSDESEADLVGMELAARAGYNPQAGITLWRKMSAASKGAPPQWLSTHPSGQTRIAEMEKNLPRVMPIYRRASKR